MRFEVGASSGVVCANARLVCLVRNFLIFQCLTFLALNFGLSALHLKCTKHTDCNSDVVQ